MKFKIGDRTVSGSKFKKARLERIKKPAVEEVVEEVVAVVEEEPITEETEE